jgi:hypothetical protein
MLKREKSQESAEEKSKTKPGKRGRPTPLRYGEIYGRAQNFTIGLGQVWERVWPLLSVATSEKEVEEALLARANPYAQDLLPLASLMFRVLREPTFPRRPKSQVRFLADSLAAFGAASPRRSRDICMQERVKAKGAHHIIRFEYYVECSCGYEGPSKNRACRKCGATIPPHLFG